MALSASDFIEQVKKEIREIDVARLREALQSSTPPVVVDCREADEFAQGIIEGARTIPRGMLEMRIEQVAPDRSTPIVVYCAVGARSALAAHSLQALGYTNVASLAGGIQAWKRA